MKRPNGNKTNAEWINEICPYDLLVQMNDKLIERSRNLYSHDLFCIMNALEEKAICRADDCVECIRLWRLAEYKNGESNNG